MNLVAEQRIIFDMEGSIRKGILHVLAETVFHEGRVSDTDTFLQELCRREQECTTGFGKGTVVPHARHAYIKEAGILFVRTKRKIEQKSIDEKSVEATVCLLAPDDKSDFHLKALSKLARRSVHEDFVDILKTAEKQQILSKVINTVS